MQNVWNTDHESWLSDVNQWGKDHAIIRSVINDLVQKLQAYDTLLDYHKHQIGDHKELIAMHGEAMDWSQRTAGKKSDPGIADLFGLEDEAHLNEADIHKRLWDLHNKLVRATIDSASHFCKLI